MNKPTSTQKFNDDVFRRLVEGVTDYAIFILSPEGIISSWNPGAERIKGYTADEIIGCHFSKFYPEEVIATDWPNEELRIASKAGRIENEGWRLRKDGSRFWANVIITALRGPNGELLGFSKITRDLTKRREYEERIRQSEERFRLLVEGVKDHAIFLLDAKGNVVSWNAGAERVTGYHAEEVIGSHVSLFYPTEGTAMDKVQRELDVAAAVGFAEDTGWRVKRNGDRFWANVIITALRNEDGTLHGFAQVARDLTERRRVEELEIEGKRVNEFIAMLGHELRNPLAPIRNAVSIMDRKETSPDLTWCKNIIGRQIEHLTRLVDDLLDLSRIMSGKIPLERLQINLSDVVIAAVEAVQPFIALYDHILEVKLPSYSIPIAGDQTRLVQVIVNLLTNAARYTPKGGRIQISGERLGATAYIRVRDNGIGMSKELIEKAFDLFVQGERTLDRAEGGLGVGLTLVKRIVTLHGGTVRILSSGPGQGSEFIVSLPALKGDAPSPPAHEPWSESTTPQNILIVDDNVDVAESLAILLRMSGHAVTLAHDGKKALELASNLAPDVVVLDIGLPGMNGYQVASRIRKLPHLAKTRLIAMTGYGQENDKQAAREAGFDAYLVKPVDYNVLAKTIDVSAVS